MDLFDYMRTNTMKQESPLASRMRPETLDQVVGQKHIVGPGTLLYRAIKADQLGRASCFTEPFRAIGSALLFFMARRGQARPLWRK